MENISFIRGFPDQEIMEDPSLFHQWNFSSIDESNSLPIAAAFGDTLHHHSYFHPNFNPRTSAETAQALETQFVSYPNLISFVDSNHLNQLGLVKPKDEMGCLQNISTTPSDMISQRTLEAKKIATHSKHSLPQDHIMAERKRREKLSQHFIALSALVPGLQKMDKVSVLGDAIKYLKQLQEKVMALEKEQNMKKNMEFVVVVKKSQLRNDVENSSAESGSAIDEELPEIEARSCDRNVLIRIHCEKIKGVVEKTIHEIEKLNLKVTNSSVMTFGSCALDITIIAQMDMEFCMTVKDLVRKLRSTFTSII